MQAWEGTADCVSQAPMRKGLDYEQFQITLSFDCTGRHF